MDSFVELVREQLEGVPDLRLKRMFGGWGVYSGPFFFGVIIDGRLYFKTDDVGSAAFAACGMGPFTYEGGALKSLWEVPPDVLEDPHELREWATRATAAARVAKAAKTSQSARTRSRRPQRE
jgi:DNA transformation protein and related proteins